MHFPKLYIACILLILSHAILYGQTNPLAGNDSAFYHPVQGKITDVRTGNPIIFANVYLAGTNIGTVSNSDGYFLIKVPLYIKNKLITVSSIGYKNIELQLDKLNPEDNLIQMEPSPIPIEEVTIVNMDAREIIHQALQKIPDNYSTEPVMVTSFYRETIKQNRSYVAVSEAVLDAYKSSYTSLTDMDRVKIFKGRKSRDVKKMDTLLLKIQGGPQTMFLLDIVKHSTDLFSEESMGYYVYQMGGIVNIDNRQAYIIDFNQLKHIDYPLYSGKIYIGVNDRAIMGAEFRISPEKLDDAAQYIIRKKPFGVQIDLLNANYLVNYRFNEGKWYLNHVRTELILAIRWKKKLFKSTFTAVSEMAVTDIDRENISKFKFRDVSKRDDIFIEKLSDFEDPDFWGEYNIIQPEESIQDAISHLSRKMQRREK